MKYYQLIYKEYGKIDAVYNEEGTTQIFKSEIEAWKFVLADCDTDLDIAYIMSQIASGVISLKTLSLHEDYFDEEHKAEIGEIRRIANRQEAVHD